MKFCVASDQYYIKGYNGQVIEFLNEIFKLKGKSHKIYKLSHVTKLSCTGIGKPTGPERMSYVEEVTREGCQNIVWMHVLEGAAHLIPLLQIQYWIVNNWVDYHV